MSTTSLKKSPRSSNVAAAKASVKSKPGSKPRSARVDSQQPEAPALKHNSTADDHKTTKQERVLTLLSRTDGASIHEMMQATKWQQHSVRGFLAGTVKKKLGFTLTSVKGKDGSRRYRIEPKRNR